jgi:hypothetical protein
MTVRREVASLLTAHEPQNSKTSAPSLWVPESPFIVKDMNDSKKLATRVLALRVRHFSVEKPPNRLAHPPRQPEEHPQEGPVSPIF